MHWWHMFPGLEKSWKRCFQHHHYLILYLKHWTTKVPECVWLGLSNLVRTTADISDKQFNLKADSLSSAVIFGFRRKPGAVWVNEFKLDYLKFPGSLIKSSAEHSSFCLDGSQMETHIWSRAKLSALCMICSVRDGRLLWIGTKFVSKWVMH